MKKFLFSLILAACAVCFSACSDSKSHVDDGWEFVSNVPALRRDGTTVSAGVDVYVRVVDGEKVFGARPAADKACPVIPVKDNPYNGWGEVSDCRYQAGKCYFNIAQ